MNPTSSSVLRRAGALVVATAITSTTLLAGTAPAQAHPAGTRALTVGGAWLAAQLEDGLLIGEFGPEYGPSIDAGLALSEAGNATGVSAVDTALRGAITSYITGEAYGDVGSTYAGATAKAATFATVAGSDPESYGGVDLVSRLEDVVSQTAPIEGRIEDVSSYGDYANVISQSFAARALTTVGSDRADEATAFLLDQQCGAGYFRFGLTSDKTSPQQGCVAGAAGSAADLDATSITVINLLSTPGASPDAIAAARSGAAWLETQQAADGSFGAGSDDGVNANTTGLAGWAMGEAGKTPAATAAAGWLRGVQVADLAPCATTLAADNGAIAPNPTDLAATRTAGGIPSAKRFTYAFATAQALPALGNVPTGAAVTLSAPATAVEKSTVTVTVTGLGAGEPGCVSFGSETKKVTGTGSPVPVTFTLPAGAATHTFRVATLTGSTTATTAATLTPVTPPVVAEPTVGDLAVAKVVKVGRKGVLRLEVDCDSTVDCAGKVKVRTVGKVKRPHGKKKVLVLAKSAYDVEAGDTAKVKLTLTKPARRVVGTQRIRVVAVQTADGADPARTKFWLRRK
ncbi:hypothetical protein [Nocardioides baculatus]|uniref:Terpene cyclase/mutase family protein n=1 Tax=Nocardioides baculatus TaxID=2801337 RepID=A0ABS1L6B5_9ACTN|nr:hypothetical protein [Nocardioides baculatus]MBL0747229.1 hypothetical protein [Nocardioides baculatus]